MSDCIFCGIVEGSIPSTKVYEDSDLLAFMDIGPIVKGHVLVIPKEHRESIADTPDDLLAKLVLAVKKIARAQLDGLRAEGINIHQSNGTVAGQVVPHIHFHLIPRYSDDGHSWNWRAQSYADSDEPRVLAERIAEGLSRQ